MSYTDPTGNSLHGRENDNTSIRSDSDDNRPGDSARESENDDSQSDEPGSSNSSTPVRDSKSDAADIGRAGTKYTNKDRQRTPDSGNLTDDVYVKNGIMTLVIRGGTYDDKPIQIER